MHGCVWLCLYPLPHSAVPLSAPFHPPPPFSCRSSPPCAVGRFLSRRAAAAFARLRLSAFRGCAAHSGATSPERQCRQYLPQATAHSAGCSVCTGTTKHLRRKKSLNTGGTAQSHSHPHLSHISDIKTLFVPKWRTPTVALDGSVFPLAVVRTACGCRRWPPCAGSGSTTPRALRRRRMRCCPSCAMHRATRWWPDGKTRRRNAKATGYDTSSARGRRVVAYRLLQTHHRAQIVSDRRRDLEHLQVLFHLTACALRVTVAKHRGGHNGAQQRQP